MFRMADRLPQDWEIDLEDLGNVYARERIQSCNACVSTSMALCVWPCNCYERDSKAEPDLMWNLDLYSRLDLADAWAFIAPINWYAAPSNLKLMFDRLVCMNGGNPREDLIDHKDPEKAQALEHSDQWHELSVNHLEGRTAAFFCYGDGGADDMDEQGRPKLLRNKSYFDPQSEPFEDERDAFRPLVWQCRFSGIEVPDDLWSYCEFGKGKKYSDNQAEDMVKEAEILQAFDAWTDRLTSFTAAKGKVPPGRYRAYEYQAPGHLGRDLQLYWRNLRMRVGLPPAGSSPEQQQRLGLNRDRTLNPSEGEGEKLKD